jgi:hypothetical protein
VDTRNTRREGEGVHSSSEGGLGRRRAATLSRAAARHVWALTSLLRAGILRGGLDYTLWVPSGRRPALGSSHEARSMAATATGARCDGNSARAWLGQSPGRLSFSALCAQASVPRPSPVARVSRYASCGRRAGGSQRIPLGRPVTKTRAPSKNVLCARATSKNRSSAERAPNSASSSRWCARQTSCEVGTWTKRCPVRLSLQLTP